LDSLAKETDSNSPKTPLENLKDILAKADAQAAAVLPPQTKAIFTIEGEEPEAVELSIPKSRIQSVLTAVQEFPQDKFSRQRLTDLLTGDKEYNSIEIKIIFSEHIKKLDELIKSYQMAEKEKF